MAQACAHRHVQTGQVGEREEVAGRKRCFEEATPTAPGPAEPHGPRRCGGPEHSVGFSLGAGDRDPVAAPD